MPWFTRRPPGSIESLNGLSLVAPLENAEQAALSLAMEDETSLNRYSHLDAQLYARPSPSSQGRVVSPTLATQRYRQIELAELGRQQVERTVRQERRETELRGQSLSAEEEKIFALAPLGNSQANEMEIGDANVLDLH
ncbi:uncharacterized protein N7443_003348 [Penicillium atrosanguineum]|uniref:uncharacterized protein n=1 Tax=Penicillium atrosanguineum TaxID=1132637 RepID=UPI0023A78C80|nr:uncharacterized protein N7443_003348 [Penicillium atrosanguineum]KAJ5310887.1 hypothetical protein N7443_003348 [Penicillium atrosanguineum]